jgi:hypothetical protein
MLQLVNLTSSIGAELTIFTERVLVFVFSAMLQADTLKCKVDVVPASCIVAAAPRHQLSQRRCTGVKLFFCCSLNPNQAYSLCSITDVCAYAVTEGGGGEEAPAFAIAMRCTSCGGEEIEILQCAGCTALFCFACSCLRSLHAHRF